MMQSRSVALSFAVVALTLMGCESVAVTAFGVGALAGVNQAINGTIDRTFTSPEADVRRATLTALKAMAVTVDAGSADAGGPIRARARGRDIEIDFEALSGRSTRMRVIAQSSLWFYYDAATGREIVAQTEKALAAASAPPSPATPASSVAPATVQAEDAPVVHPVHLESAPAALSPPD